MIPASANKVRVNWAGLARAHETWADESTGTSHLIGDWTLRARRTARENARRQRGAAIASDRRRAEVVLLAASNAAPESARVP